MFTIRFGKKSCLDAIGSWKRPIRTSLKMLNPRAVTNYSQNGIAGIAALALHTAHELANNSRIRLPMADCDLQLTNALLTPRRCEHRAKQVAGASRFPDT